MINYISTHSTSQIKLVKITPLAGFTLEYYLPGYSDSRPYYGDQQTPDHDALSTDCGYNATSNGAAQWLAAYGTPSLSFPQAMEKVLGTVAGHLYATLKNANNLNFGLSLATDNANGIPQVNCGLNGTSTCMPQTVTTPQQQWGLYYAFGGISHLFPASGTSTIALTAAQAASLANNNVPFALTLSQFFVNTTMLQDPTPSCTDGTVPDCPALSRSSFSCDLNEVSTSSTQEGSFLLGLGSGSTAVPGVGTQLGIQTMTRLNSTPYDACSPPAGDLSLGGIFNYAISNGSQYIEATPDIAADTACQPYLHTALVGVASQTLTNCLY